MGFTLDGDYFSTEVAPGFKSRTVITGSSLDGSVMVGYGTGSPEGHTYGPVKVVDGEYRPLPCPNSTIATCRTTKASLRSAYRLTGR